MGKNRKGYNWKARQQAQVTVHQGPAIAVEGALAAKKQEDGDLAGGEDPNCLILPSTKRRTDKKTENVAKAKFVSRRQKKMQERLKEKRIKSSKRGDLIKAIQAVQATEEEMKQFTTITQMQTTGLKRHFRNIKRAEQDAKRPKMEVEIRTDSLPEELNSSDIDTSDEEYSSTPFPLLTTNPFPSTKAKNTTEKTEKTEKNQEKEPVQSVQSVQSVRSDRSRSGSPTEPTVGVSKPMMDNPFRKVKNVVVERTEEIQLSRAKLPVTSEEQTIMEAINENPIIIVTAETGSGKTTQIPQFLYEAGYASGEGIIGMTEPRRVAAISMAQRIGLELNKPKEVSYQIRYEGNVNPHTKIKLMTDGVLTRELASDFLLTRYSVIVIDEAHERSVHTDVLIGLLSRIVHLRAKRNLPLKLIIMSATLQVDDFRQNPQLFPLPPPEIRIEGRSFDVNVHFNTRTPGEGEYLEEAYRKTCKIHRELPSGAVLVFVTGQQEVQALCKRLRETFPFRGDGQEREEGVREGAGAGEVLSKKGRRLARSRFKLEDYADQAIDEEEGEAVSDAEAEGEDVDGVTVPERNSEPMYVLPLYSLLPTSKQELVFQPPPSGCRLCVVTTNVAETSLTIPDVKYVVDTGKTKVKVYDRNTGLSTFRVVWNSKAASQQRKGRAGRTVDGHCYRLFSSAVFQSEFPEFTPPEITRRPIEDLVLQMKAMNIEKVLNFPFPTPPSRESLIAAERELLSLGAVETVKGEGTRITTLGRTMSQFPVAPRFAKMLALSGKNNLMPYMVSLVAALTVQEPFLEGKLEDGSEELSEDRREEQAYFLQLKKRWIGQGFSRMLGDLMVLLKAVNAAEFSGLTPAFCTQHCLRFKAMKEIRLLRQQLTNALLLTVPHLKLTLDPHLPPPTELQAKLISQVILSCMGSKMARKVPEGERGVSNVGGERGMGSVGGKRSVGTAGGVGGEEKRRLRHAYQTLSLEEFVYLHPSSVLFGEEPEYVLYQELFEGKKIYCRNVMEVKAEWIAKYVQEWCTYGAPLEVPEPRFDEGRGKVLCHRTSTCGPQAWPLPAVEVDYPEGVELHRWFGRFLMEGLVCGKLREFTEHLLIKPVVMIKSWADVHPATQTLLQALVEKKVSSREKLLLTWQEDQSYLLHEYLQWLPQGYRTRAASLWPPK